MSRGATGSTRPTRWLSGSKRATAMGPNPSAMAENGRSPWSVAITPGETFWVPLADLADPKRQRLHYVMFRGEQLERPAIDLLGPGRTVLWGITYRLVSHFMQLAGSPLPPTPIP